MGFGEMGGHRYFVQNETINGALDRVHRVLEKSLKVPEKSLNLNVPYFEIFAFKILKKAFL